MMLKAIRPLIDRFVAFRADEDGAVTTDFVVLTASVMMLGMAHARDVAIASVDIGDNVSGCLGTDIATLVVDGDPKDYIQNLEAAAAACSSR